MSKSSFFGKNEILFVFFRYLSYGILAVRGFVFAYALGPYFLGIYGYLMLYQQYFSYSNLGLQYSVNSELALSNDDREKKNIMDSAITGTLIISGVLVILSLAFFFSQKQLFPYENSNTYIFVLLPLTVFSNFQQIFVNFFRVEKQLKPIIFGELLVAISALAVIPFFSGIKLVDAIFYTWTISIILVLIYYVRVYEYSIKLAVSRLLDLVKVGLPILVYVFSYYLMGLMVRSLIGAFYPVNVMGYFSFANNLTTAVMLGLDTITWIIFPSLIAKIGSNKFGKGELESYLVSFTNKLFVLVVVIVGLSIITLPVLFYFLPKYSPIEYSLIVLLVNQIVFNSGFAFVTLCIARKTYIQMAIISLLSVLVGGGLSAIFCFYDFPYIWLVVSNVIGSLCFINILIYFISREFSLDIKKLRSTLSWFIQIIFILIIIAAIYEMYSIILILLTIILLLRLRSLKELYFQLLGAFFKKKN